MVIFTTAGEARRYVRISNLILTASDDPHPRYAAMLAGGEHDDIVYANMQVMYGSSQT